MSVFGRFAGAVGPMNTGKWSGDGDVGGPPTPSQPSPGARVEGDILASTDHHHHHHTT